MTREEAKDLFRKDKDSYGKPKGIMGKIDLIYDDFELQYQKQNMLIKYYEKMIENEYGGSIDHFISKDMLQLKKEIK
jgi:hypothetical protein